MSQLGADDWVLSVYGQEQPGFFVDVGCGDGKHLSNTYKLETGYGWRGICIDPLAKNFEDRPRSVVEEKVVYSTAGRFLEFVVATPPEYSGLLDHLDRHRDRVLASEQGRRVLETTTLLSILQDYGAPAFIHYLSLDTEGSEYEVLRTFDFSSYRFGLITVQHNYEESKRWGIQHLLHQHGYRLVKSVRWEDWYAHASVHLPSLSPSAEESS